VAGLAQTPAWRLRAAEAGLGLAALAVLLAADPAPVASTLVLVVSFVALTAYDTAVLVRSAGATLGVTRRRMQAAALGSVALAGAVVGSGLATIDPARAEPWTVLSRLLALTSALGYYVGFAPPAWLRRAWQAPAL
jgi:hypothetical protein